MKYTSVNLSMSLFRGHNSYSHHRFCAEGVSGALPECHAFVADFFPAGEENVKSIIPSWVRIDMSEVEKRFIGIAGNVAAFLSGLISVRGSACGGSVTPAGIQTDPAFRPMSFAVIVNGRSLPTGLNNTDNHI